MSTLKKISFCFAAIFSLNSAFADIHISSSKDSEKIHCEDNKQNSKNKKGKDVSPPEHSHQNISNEKKNIFNKDKGVTCSETKGKSAQEQAKLILGNK